MMQSASLWITFICCCETMRSFSSHARRSRAGARLHRADLPPERRHVDDEVLDDRQVAHRGDRSARAQLRDDRLHARLAGEHGGAVHAHAARAADHHPAALAVRERAVDAVLDDVEHVEQRHPLGRVDLVLLQRAVARRRVVAPDLSATCMVSTSSPPAATWSSSRASSRASAARRSSSVTSVCLRKFSSSRSG